MFVACAYKSRLRFAGFASLTASRKMMAAVILRQGRLKTDVSEIFDGSFFFLADVSLKYM